MVRKASVILFVFLVLVVLAVFFLTACETAGGPQATATSKPSTPKPTGARTTPSTPSSGQPYPDVPPTSTPTIESYPSP